MKNILHGLSGYRKNENSGTAARPDPRQEILYKEIVTVLGKDATITESKLNQ